MKVGISLLFLLLCSHIFAQVTLEDVKKLGLVQYQSVEVLEDPYSLLVFLEKGEQVIQLFNGNKIILDKRVSSITDSFRSIQFKTFDNSENPYAVILLQKGVHGEQVYIFSLVDGKEVFHLSSVWPMEVNISSSKVEAIAIDENKKKIPKTWSP